MITRDQYEKLLDDRPRKFSTDEVGFEMKAARGEWACRNCWHWYQAPVANRNTCEITTGPDPETRHIPAESSCRWFTPDGERFPRQEPEKPAPRAKTVKETHTVT